MLMDVSSEMIHSLLPVYLISVLGVSAVTIGFIEGAAEATAQITKIFSGALSDYLGKRKGLAILGYGLSAVTKPIFALAPGVGWILTARLTDRVGKGIRGAPRDALVADLVPSSMRGAAYGLRQSLDTLGALAGPLIAVGLMLLWANDYQAVFWVAAIPAVLAVSLLMFGVREPGRPVTELRRNPISRDALRQLDRPYWWVVILGAVFTLARFSEAFLLLRAQSNGLAIAWLPIVLVTMNLAYAVSAYPFGKLADRFNHQHLLMIGLCLLIIADLILALGDHWLWTLCGSVVWGFHMGMTQGLLATMVANAAPKFLRGTAFGFFNLVSGIALLVASVLAGLLWQYGGPALTFYGGAGFCIVTLAGLAMRPRKGRSHYCD
ncbi:MFS transporter [Marinobacter sp.]|uniref:MFS transporter n=1 Tax=Marinobacter sp. TaxID=50741 RepID=UPI003A93CBAA